MAKMKLFAKLKSIKHIEIILAVAAVLVMLGIYCSTFIGGKTLKTESQPTKIDYRTEMEQALADTIASVSGAGSTKVMIGWESGVESIIAYVTNSNGNSTSSSPQLVTENGVTKPIVLKEIYPKAIGVVIICEGGDNVRVQLDIIDAVGVLLGVTPDKVKIIKMKK